MRIDLRSQAKAKGYRRRTIKMPVLNPTRAQEQNLAAAYMRVVRMWSQAINRRILPAYIEALKQQAAITRDRAGDVEVEIELVEMEQGGVFNWFKSFVSKWAGDMLLWHTRKVVSSLKYSTNVDLSTQMSVPDEGISMTMEQMIARNVNLIKDLSDQERGRIADILFRGLQARTSPKDIAAQLREVTSLARDRALRIASDQSVKLMNALDRERQLQLGMLSFEWIHSAKLHFRPAHKARDHKVFNWSSEVAKTDPPGYLPFCGCKAKGILIMDEDD